MCAWVIHAREELQYLVNQFDTTLLSTDEMIVSTDEGLDLGSDDDDGDDDDLEMEDVYKRQFKLG